jgi:hypothetical protein
MVASFQIKLPEQKAPLALGPLRLTYEAFASRGQGNGGTSHLDGSEGYGSGLASLPDWSNPFCQRLNSFESPRAPPLMDPPILC